MLAFGLLLTILSWVVTRGSFSVRTEERFARMSTQIANAVEARMQVYIDALVHTRALFEVEEEVDRSQFREFVGAMGIERRYPGNQGIGYTVKLEPDEVSAHEREVQGEGFPHYRVWPITERDQYHAILYLEPFDWRNQRAFGYDMSTDPVRREAMARARDTGRPAASAPVVLVQETEVQRQPGFLVYVPHYRDGAPTDTVAQRRAAIEGFVYSPFRSRDLFNGIFEAGGDLSDLRFEVYGSDGTLLYSSAPQPEEESDFRQNLAVEVAGQQWGILVESLPRFRTHAERAISAVVLAFGLTMSFGIFGILLHENKQRVLEKKLLAKEQLSRLAAEEALRVRDDFLSIASHELKTPLTSLTLQVHLLARILNKVTDLGPEKERVDRAVSATLRQVDRLSAQVDDLLDITRIRGGRFRINPEEVDLTRVVREVVARFETELERGGYQLDIETQSPVRGVWDRYRIEQVIVNLLTNAMKYGESRPITIRVWAENGHAVVCVRDRGIGIPPDAQGHIFERFERSVPAERFAGLGLGLFIVKQIVDAHKGSIAVESEPGKGSTFTLRLPLRMTNRQEGA